MLDCRKVHLGVQRACALLYLYAAAESDMQVRVKDVHLDVLYPVSEYSTELAS